MITTIYKTPLKSVCITLIFILGFQTIYSQVKVALDDRKDYTEQASALFERGKWEEGKIIVDEGLDKHPKDSDLNMLSGKYHHHYKEYDRARYDLIKALRQNPGNVDAKHILVNVETDSKRYSSAICYVNELLEINPYWRGLWRKKIAIYELQGNNVEASRLRKRIMQIYPEDSELQEDYLYSAEMQAIASNKSANIEQAIALSKELVNQKADNPEYYLMLINNYLKAGDQYNAQSYIEQGLDKFPKNLSLIDKKTGLLAEQNRYNELLGFLQQEIKSNNSPELKKQYNYYLLEAARDAKNRKPATLYGKVLEQNPGNEEAFEYVFIDVMGTHQYEEALGILNKQRKARGNSKKLSIMELMVYNRMGNKTRGDALAKQLFLQYPDDADLRINYAVIMLNEAKDKMAEERYSEAITAWDEVWKYGDSEMKKVAQNAIFNAYMAMGNTEYNNALNALNAMIEADPSNADLYVKRADVYWRQKKYKLAIATYEQALHMVDEDVKQKHLGGYSDMITQIVKELNEQFRYRESLAYVKEWLKQDPNNLQALQYAVNLSFQTKNAAEIKRYAQMGKEAYPEEVYFKIKLAEIEGKDNSNFERIYLAMHQDVLKNPYNIDLINAFTQVSDDYGNQLIKNKDLDLARKVLDTALYYSPENKTLKYSKGRVFEKLKQYDSAYAYQSVYEPDYLEENQFKQHLYYLNYKSNRNEIGIYHLRSRYGDEDIISTVSTLEYSFFGTRNTYVGRVNYAGRNPGKGVQIQLEWGRILNERTRFKVDAAWANQFFPEIMLNASIYRQLNILNGLEGELGLGYRKLVDDENFLNLVVGATKELDKWRFNSRFNNFVLDGQWLYNFSLNARYYIASPKSYVTAMGSIGSSPDIEMIDYRLYDGFSVLNTMVGVGGSHLLTKNLSVGVLGTWYNYKNDQNTNFDFRNLYNLYLQIHVAF